jgi:ABC-type glycerol-3-phosphate transport system permease component
MTVGTVAGTLLLAVPAAYVLAQWRFAGRSALFGLVLLAIAVPGALTLFPQARALVWMGLINTRLGVMLIYISLDLPVAIFFLRAAFAAVPNPLIEAMRVDGASTARIATRLFLPMSASTLAVVVVLTVLQVWNDSLIMIVMTSSPSLYTLPVLVATGLGGTAALGATWLTIGPPLLVFLASQRHFHRGIAPGPLL